jgi:hypothetical protein
MKGSKAVKGADSGVACDGLGWHFVECMGICPEGSLNLLSVLCILNTGRFLNLAKGHPLIECVHGYITRYPYRAFHFIRGAENEAFYLPALCETTGCVVMGIILCN